MKRSFLLLLLLAIAGGGILLLQSLRSQDTSRTPQPLSMPQLVQAGAWDGSARASRRGERKLFKEQRRQWMEQLHRCAPETDWRTRDRASRARLQTLRQAERQQMQLAGLNPDQQPVTLRDGSREVLGSWQERGSNNQAGRMHCAVLTPAEVLYAGSSGGIVWQGNLAGSSWEPLNDWMRFPDIQGLAWLPAAGQNAARLLVLHRGSSMLAWTADQGQSWSLASGLDSPVNWGSPKRLAVTPQGTVLLLAAEWDYDAWQSATGLYVSLDRGSSFQRAALLDANSSLVDFWFPDSGGADSEGLLLQGADLYTLDHLGNRSLYSTLPLVHGLTAVRRTLLDARGQGNTLEAAACIALDSGESEIYGSETGAQDWEHRGTAPLTAFMQNSFELDQQDGSRLYLGGVDAWRSSNGGASWSRVNNWWEYYDHPDNKLHADIPGIQCLQNSQGEQVILVSTDGGVYTSTDGLQSVQNISLQGLRISQYYGSYTHQQFPAISYAGAQDQGFQRSTGDNGGLIDFEQTISGDYAHLVSGDGGWSLWCVYPGFAMYYPQATAGNQALFWDFTMSGQYWLPPLLADPGDPAVVWLGGGGSNGQTRMYRLDADGGSISVQPGPAAFGSNSPISAMAVSPLDNQRWFVMTGDGDFFSSVNAGSSWSQSPGFSGPEGHYFHGADIVVSPTTPGELWVCGSGYDNPAVYHSTDYGQNFSAMDDGIPGTLVYAMAISADGQYLFAASELGPWVWDGVEQSWQALAGASAPDQVYWNVEWVELLNSARFVTYGRGIWDFTIEEELVLVPPQVQISVNGNIVLLDWADIPGASTYRIEARTSAGLAWQTLAISSASDTALRDEFIEHSLRQYRVIALSD